jgi:hypothetical protein
MRLFKRRLILLQWKLLLGNIESQLEQSCGQAKKRRPIETR